MATISLHLTDNIIERDEYLKMPFTDFLNELCFAIDKANWKGEKENPAIVRR